ncbi:MAG: protein kinase [Myxococcales bacterium]|nr:protein kinase [Myxococcales bacterium]
MSALAGKSTGHGLEVGSLVAGRYRVEALLGRGGMAQVYRVHDAASRRQLALKHFNPAQETAHATLATLFEREYHTLAQLSHPNIVRVHDYGIDAGRAYYTMDLLEGQMLRSLAPMPWKQACEVIAQVCSALALLHSRSLLHRDVAPRNVYCDDQLHATLIDFGTMTPMGPATFALGTAPALPPEGLGRQSLDARSDLYGVGSLLYFALTKTYAYPAHYFRELEALWAKPLKPPTALVPEVPEFVDSLVLSLLSLDPVGRPSSAAEVIERLEAVARDSERTVVRRTADDAAAGRPYLVAPKLVDRAASLVRIDRHVGRLANGRGGLLVIAGEEGSGRTRMLEAFTLSATLAGATVLRADAAEVLPDAFAVIRASLADLLQADPDLLYAAAEPHGDVLGHAWPALHTRLGRPELRKLSGLERSEAISEAFGATIERLSMARPVALAIDNLESCDAASIGVLAALVREALRQPIALTFTRNPSVSDTQTLEDLVDNGETIHLYPLDREAIYELLASIFGRPPGIEAVCQWVEALAGGSPRTVMDLAQHLVDRGAARHARGAFRLPNDLRALDLPETFEDTLQAQVEALPPEARQVATTLALALPHAPLPVSALAQLTGGGSASGFEALEVLNTRRIVSEQAEHYQLRHVGWTRALTTGLIDSERREHHGRLARAFAAVEGDPMIVAHHLQQAELDGEALELLQELGRERFPRSVSRPGDARRARIHHEVLSRALEHARSNDASPAQRYVLLEQINRLAAHYHVPHRFDEAFDQLYFDCGFDLWGELQGLDGPARLTQATAAAAERRKALPVAQRGLSPNRALTSLGAAISVASGRYLSELDGRGHDRLADLLEPLAEAFPQVRQAVAVQRAGTLLLRGMAARPEPDSTARDLSELLLLQNSLTDAEFVVGANYYVGLEQARLGKPDPRHVRAIEGMGGSRDFGRSLALVFHLFQGRAVEAEAARDDLDRLEARGAVRVHIINSLFYELEGWALLQRLEPLGRALRRVELMAHRYPTWVPVLHLGLGHRLRCRGEHAAAIEAYERAVELAPPGEHLAYTAAEAGLLMAMNGAGQFQAFELRAERALGEIRRLDLHRLAEVQIHAERALCRARLGDARATERHLEQALGRGEALEIGGLPMCAVLEVCGRAALELGDHGRLERLRERLRAVVAESPGPVLEARLRRFEADIARSRAGD